MFCGGSSFASHGPARPAAGTPTASVYRAARDGTWSPLGRAGALGGLLFAGALPRYAPAWAAAPAPCRNLVFVGLYSRGCRPCIPAPPAFPEQPLLHPRNRFRVRPFI
jgi:hypothetical protein